MSTPWSQQREARLNVVKTVLFYLVLGTFAGAGGGAVRGNWRLFFSMLIAMFCAILADLWVMNALAAMAPNRPAGDLKRMTRWRFWPHTTDTFFCDCGARLSFALHGHDLSSAVPAWSPNDGRNGSDPGGGRWCIVCAHCGRGHYKFNVDPRSVTARDVMP